jgi:hypothetical protein
MSCTDTIADVSFARLRVFRDKLHMILHPASPHASISLREFRISSMTDRCTDILSLLSCSWSSTARTSIGGLRPRRCARFQRLRRAIPTQGYRNSVSTRNRPETLNFHSLRTVPLYQTSSISSPLGSGGPGGTSAPTQYSASSSTLLIASASPVAPRPPRVCSARALAPVLFAQ